MQMNNSMIFYTNYIEIPSEMVLLILDLTSLASVIFQQYSTKFEKGQYAFDEYHFY